MVRSFISSVRDTPAAPLAVKLGVLALAVLLTPGCSFMPEYRRPALPVADTYPGQAGTPGPALNTNAATQASTGEFFLDPVLKSLIKHALEHNRDLRIAALNVEQARAILRIQRSDLFPTVMVQADMNRGNVPMVAGPGADSGTATLYRAGFGLAAYELDFFGRVRSLNEAALNSYLATAEAQQAATVAVTAQVAQAYLTQRMTIRQLALATRTLASRQESRKLISKRVEAGTSSVVDLRQSDILVDTARTVVASLERQQQQAGNALRLLIGDHRIDLSGPLTTTASPVMTDTPAGLPSDLLSTRPDIRTAERRLIAANASIGAARAAFFPRISLTGSFGTTSTELSDLFSAGTRAWSFIPQLVVPLFDAGRNQANLDAAVVRNNLLVAEYEKAIQVAFREVADALAANATLKEQLLAQADVVKAQAERLRLVEIRAENGMTSSLEVFDVQREVFNAEQTLLQIELLRLASAIDLHKALGGRSPYAP